jgi:MYXO-CTERM domain-containing protein
VVGASGGCASAPAPNPTPGSAGASSAGTPTPPPDCAPPTETKQCIPPYYALYPNIQPGDIGEPRGTVSETPTTANNPGSATGSTGSETSNGAVPPAPTDGNKADANTQDTTSSAGCSVAHASHTSPLLAVFGALGLLSVLRRRRAR